MEERYVAKEAYAVSEGEGVAIKFRIDSGGAEGTRFLSIRIVDEAAGTLLETLRRVFAERSTFDGKR